MKKIIKIPFANFYEDASFSSQIVTQGVMWEIAAVLDVRGDWVRLRLPDGYEGWTQNFSTLDLSEAMESQIGTLLRVRIHTPHLAIRFQSGVEGPRDAVAAMGAAFPYFREQDCRYEVMMPDGKHAYLHQEALPDLGPREIILHLAARLLGTAYFWGGKTENGCDCSGITQLSFGLAGIALPRDASQQIKVLKEHPVKLSEAEPGDLAFFQNDNGRITHVAIMRNTPEFIHSSGEVKLNSFDPAAPHYSEKLDRMLEGIYSIRMLIGKELS